MAASTTKKSTDPDTTEEVAKVADSTAPDTRPENTDVDRAGTGPDRVAMVSLRADGTPDQTPDYEVIVDEPDHRLAPLEPAAEDGDKADDPAGDKSTSSDKS